MAGWAITDPDSGKKRGSRRNRQTHGRCQHAAAHRACLPSCPLGTICLCLWPIWRRPVHHGEKEIYSSWRANSNFGSLTASEPQAMAAPPVNRAMKSRAAAPAPAASGECRLASPRGPGEAVSHKSPANCFCAPAAAPKSARTAAAAQAPAKSMRQLNKENEDLQIKVEELSSSLHSAQAGKQAAKAAFEVSRLRFRRRLASCGS
jgi:hypothetical protein